MSNDARVQSPSPDPHHDVDFAEGRLSQKGAEQLRDAFARLLQPNRTEHVCVFFHGGLVSESDGLKAAHSLFPDYSATGAYPFFFIWHSGLWDRLDTLLRPYAEDPAFVRVTDRALSIVGNKISSALDTSPALRAHARALQMRPRATTLEEVMTKARPFDLAWATRKPMQLGVTNRELDDFNQLLMDLEKSRPAKERMFRPKDLRGYRNVFWRIVHRLNTGHDHGVSTTIIEEFYIALGLNDIAGETIWGWMKRLIDKAFDKDPLAGATVFLDELCKLWRARPTLRVTLIGHSAGSIYVNRFLEALEARQDSEAHAEVMFMAAALSFRRMADALPVWNKRVSRLRVFGLTDRVEGGYPEIPGVYNKSLLYLASALCEDNPDADEPLVGMQRYWKDKPPYQTPTIRAVTHFIGEPRSVWSPTLDSAKPGYRSKATHHGRFPEERETKASVCYALRNGLASERET
jgi:hypothetical protein